MRAFLLALPPPPLRLHKPLHPATLLLNIRPSLLLIFVWAPVVCSPRSPFSVHACCVLLLLIDVSLVELLTLVSPADACVADHNLTDIVFVRQRNGTLTQYIPARRNDPTNHCCCNCSNNSSTTNLEEKISGLSDAEKVSTKTQYPTGISSMNLLVPLAP